MLKKIAKILFWLLVVFLLLIQVIALFNEGANTSTLVLVSEVLVFAFFGFVYLLRIPLSNISKIISSHKIRFILIGYLAAMFAETAYIFSNPIHRNLFWDLVLTTPWYVLWMALWYRVLRKYRFSLREAFYLGGLNGFFVEGVFTGFVFFNPALGLLSIPLMTTIYGAFFIVPYLLTSSDFHDQQEISLRKKIAESFIPLLAYIPGVIWILLLVVAFNLQLH